MLNHLPATPLIMLETVHTLWKVTVLERVQALFSTRSCSFRFILVASRRAESLIAHYHLPLKGIQILVLPRAIKGSLPASSHAHA